jgi:glucose/arabinose dehydrogenase
MSPRGYKIVRVLPNGKPQDFVTGFLNQDLTVNGRPCGVLRVGPDAFLFTDDHSGVIYYVFRKDL